MSIKSVDPEELAEHLGWVLKTPPEERLKYLQRKRDECDKEMKELFQTAKKPLLGYNVSDFVEPRQALILDKKKFENIRLKWLERSLRTQVSHLQFQFPRLAYLIIVFLCIVVPMFFAINYVVLRSPISLSLLERLRKGELGSGEKKLLSAIKAYEQENQYEKAVALSQELRELTGNNTETVRLLDRWGKRYLNFARNPYQALEKFEMAYKIDPGNKIIKNNLADSFEIIADIQLEENPKQKELALRNYLKSYELNGKSSTAEKIAVRLAKYDDFDKLGNDRKVEDCLKEAIRSSDIPLPSLDARVQKLMDQAEAYLSSHRFKEAGGLFRKALHKNPYAGYFYYMDDAKALLRSQNSSSRFAEKVDLNEADLLELRIRLKIPFKDSVKIIENRPYHNEEDLLLRKVLKKNEFDQIKNMVTVQDS